MKKLDVSGVCFALCWVFFGLFVMYEVQRFAGLYASCTDKLSVYQEFLESSVCKDGNLRIKFERAALIHCHASREVVTKETTFNCALKDWFMEGTAGILMYHMPGELYTKLTSVLALFVVFPIILLFGFLIKTREEGNTKRIQLMLEHQNHQTSRFVEFVTSATNVVSKPKSPWVQMLDDDDAGESPAPVWVGGNGHRQRLIDR